MDKRRATEFLGYLLRDKNIERTIYEDALKIAIESLKTQLSKESTTKDAISRQAAIDAVDAIGHIATMPDGDKCIRRSAVKYTLSMLPPVQPEPHEGEWINTNPEYKNGFYNNSYYCSECHDYYTTSPYEMKFCPNCGADMRGEQE